MKKLFTLKFASVSLLVLWCSFASAQNATFDMLDWMTMDPFGSHMTGTGTPVWTLMDPNHGKFYWVKGAHGYPWDVKRYDANFIYDLVQNSPGPTTISGNTVIQMQDAGIKVVSSPSVSILSNTIPANPFSAGIWLIGATNNLVKSNRISNAAQGVIIDDNGVPGNTTATGNVISDSNCGMKVETR